MPTVSIVALFLNASGRVKCRVEMRLHGHHDACEQCAGSNGWQRYNSQCQQFRPHHGRSGQLDRLGRNRCKLHGLLRDKDMKWLFVALALISSPALAQQQPDPAFLQRALSAIEQQRNAALNAQAVAEAGQATLADENSKLKARIQELERPAEQKPAN